MSHPTAFNPPPFRVYKATPQGYVNLPGQPGRRKYLGNVDNPQKQQGYARLVSELAAHGRLASRAMEAISVAELVAAFWAHAKVYYRKPDGKPSGRRIG